MRDIKRNSTISLCLLLLLCFSIYAQPEDRKLNISGQIRLRSENDMRDFNNDTEDIDYALLRTRLNFKFDYLDKVIAFANSRIRVRLALKGHREQPALSQIFAVSIYTRAIFRSIACSFPGFLKNSIGSNSVMAMNDWLAPTNGAMSAGRSMEMLCH